ncbi:hypothetical protein H9Q69_005658 [Fusarium xylarioides]|nr:hypothetical protein H9Q69_005658 [Fusarium xylarioides]
MTNSIGLVGSLGAKLAHDKVKTRLNKIDVQVVKKESDLVPNYVVAAKASDIPEKWSGATQMPKQWLQAMMDITPIRDLAWIDPEEWKANNKQGGVAEDEEGDGGEEARGKKRNTEALIAEIKAEAEGKQAPKAAKDQAAKDQADKDQADKDQADKDQVKQESAETDLSSVPANGSNSSESPSPGPDSSSNSSERSTPASSTARSLSPEAEDAEKQAQNAIIKAREARTELERAQRAATEAVDNARTLGAAVTYIPDLQPDDPCAFVIPGYMRKEKTPAMGRIAYNTDKGYFLVLETSFNGRHRMYMFSGSQYFSNRDAFVKKYKWKTLVANVHAGEEQDEDDKLWTRVSQS